MTKITYFENDYQVKLAPFKVEAAAVDQPVPDNVWVTGAPILWKQNLQGTGCKVGVIDSGIDDKHPDLAGKVLFRRDYVNDGKPPGQFNVHGTHVAGTICANGSIKGVAPLASVIDYRVLNTTGSGSYEHIIKAINDSVTDGCNIINMSLGGAYNYAPMETAIKNAVAKNVLVVVAAGNEGPGKISYPAYYQDVVGVGAVNFDRVTGNVNLPQTPWFSNSNNQVDVCADGYRVFSTLPNGTYGYLSGTSMASPCVAGFAALLWEEYNKKLSKTPSEDELYSILKNTTVDVLTVGNDFVAGAGFVTAYPEVPRKNSTGQWTLPNMVTGQP